MAKRTSTAELQKENARLTIALEAALKRLDLYESINDIFCGWIVGEVINITSQLVLIRSNDVVYGVTISQLDIDKVKQGERYILPFAGEESYYSQVCHTHHIRLHAKEIIPTTIDVDAVISPQQRLTMQALADYMNTFGKVV